MQLRENEWNGVIFDRQHLYKSNFISLWWFIGPRSHCLSLNEVFDFEQGVKPRSFMTLSKTYIFSRIGWLSYVILVIGSVIGSVTYVRLLVGLFVVGRVVGLSYFPERTGSSNSMLLSDRFFRSIIKHLKQHSSPMTTNQLGKICYVICASHAI